MKMLITKHIGRNKYTFEAEGSNFHEVVWDSQKLSFPDVFNCGLCNSDALVLGARKAGKDGEYEYTYVKCLQCKGELTFGQKKKGDVFYLRRDDDKKYEWKKYEDKDGNSQGSQSNKQNEDDSSDLPF